MASTTEEICPQCGVGIRRGVIRCRDCGAYLDPELEAARQARLHAAAFSSPTDVEADDSDFDINGMAMLAEISPGGLGGTADAPVLVDDADDDFELGDDVVVIDDLPQQAFSRPAVPPAAVPVESAAAPAASAEAPQDDYALAADVTEEDSAPEAPPTAAEASPDAPPAATPPMPDLDIPDEPDAGSDGAGASGDTPHSERTAGDLLLAAALEEEQELARRSKLGRRRPTRSVSTDEFIVFCPNGHRIVVHERHRGRVGRCPHCKSPFFVPVAPTTAVSSEGSAEGEGAPTSSPTGSEGAGLYSQWVQDVHLHAVNPAKLKLTPDSLVNDYDTCDLTASEEHLLLVTVFKGGGAFRNFQEPKKKGATREALLAHLAEGLPVDDLPVPFKEVLELDRIPAMKLAQPVPVGEESLFAEIPVFGVGRIAVRLPLADEKTDRHYLSFTLSQFRELSRLIDELLGIGGFGEGADIPFTDEYDEYTCHYSEASLQSLKHLEYYQADPAIQLKLQGWKCEGCGLVVGEDSRKKEKIGGSSAASVPKAKCPKCKKKFGNQPLYAMEPSAG